MLRCLSVPFGVRKTKHLWKERPLLSGRCCISGSPVRPLTDYAGGSGNSTRSCCLCPHCDCTVATARHLARPVRPRALRPLNALRAVQMHLRAFVRRSTDPSQLTATDTAVVADAVAAIAAGVRACLRPAAIAAHARLLRQRLSVRPLCPAAAFSSCYSSRLYLPPDRCLCCSLCVARHSVLFVTSRLSNDHSSVQFRRPHSRTRWTLVWEPQDEVLQWRRHWVTGCA